MAMSDMVKGLIVKTVIEETELDGDYGNSVDGITVTCRRCGHTVEVFGTEEASEKRGAVMLREECPKGEINWYEADYGENLDADFYHDLGIEND